MKKQKILFTFHELINNLFENMLLKLDLKRNLNLIKVSESNMYENILEEKLEKQVLNNK